MFCLYLHASIHRVYLKHFLLSLDEMIRFLFYKICMFAAAIIMLGHNVVAHHHYEHCHQHESGQATDHQHQHHGHHHSHSHTPAEVDFFHLLAHLHHSPDGFVCVSHQSLMNWKWQDFNSIPPNFYHTYQDLFEIPSDPDRHPIRYKDFICQPQTTLHTGLRAPPVFII